MKKSNGAYFPEEVSILISLFKYANAHTGILEFNLTVSLCW